MALWAELDEDNIVSRVVVCDSDDGDPETVPDFLADLPGCGTWQRTYYRTPGHTYAGIGYTWDAELGDFVPPET